jgi:diol dehydratase reactivase alpha subunit
VFRALTVALEKAGKSLPDLALVRINEAAPVIGDVAMETITETIITESTMIGHNPATPGGLGIGVGTTVLIQNLASTAPGKPYIVVADRSFDHDAVADAVNDVCDRLVVTGAILQKDDGVLVHNRLRNKIPIVDEVGLVREGARSGCSPRSRWLTSGKIIETLVQPVRYRHLLQAGHPRTRQVGRPGGPRPGRATGPLS